MKKLIIGRNNACDIIIPDTTDVVSRKQAILTFTFFGKKVLYDTSNNGTYVNGKKLENGKGIKVTRKDKVSFARVAELNWNEVKDPYRKMKILSVVAFLLAAAIAAILVFALPTFTSEDKNPTPTVQQKKEVADTVQIRKPITVEPKTEQPITIPAMTVPATPNSTPNPTPNQVRKQTEKGQKKKSVSNADSVAVMPDDDTEVATPIVY